MSVRAKAISVCLIVGSLLLLAACGSSNSSSSSSAAAGAPPSSGSSSSSGGGGNTVDIYSSLPLQGASTAQTDPMVNGIKLALSQAGNKAGNFNVNYQSLDDSTAAAGKWDPGQTAANARKVAGDPEGRLLHRRVQLGRVRGLDPDPQPGRGPDGQPRQHLCRPDHQPARLGSR